MIRQLQMAPSKCIQEKIMIFESNITHNSEGVDTNNLVNIERKDMIPPIQSSVPPGVVVDANGLIVPKKLINPCLASRDRKDLHRELLFSQKVGQPIIKQKTELQKALQKQKERQFQSAQQGHEQERSFSSEFDHMITERSKRLTGGWSDHQLHQQSQQQYHYQHHQQYQHQQHHQQHQHRQHQQLQHQQQQQQHQYKYPLQRYHSQPHQSTGNSQEDLDQLNPDYIKARAKLRVTMDNK